MISFIWATLLFSVRSSNADTGASVGKQFCDKKFCISLIEGEITAEAGLCVVIPCSFTYPDFKLQSIVWFKCEPFKKKCNESVMKFHSNKKPRKVQSAFREGVSLLEPDLSQKNCSIIINDLKESDSGSYQLRVNGKKDGFTFFPKANVSVKGLSQKPTVMIPPLTEGHQTTLSCTAPGLCSGSVPEITWTWRGAGVNDSHITGNITDFKTENLTAVTQRHSSTLTFDPSAEHHGTEVTCKVRFTGDRTTEETVTLNVSYVKEVKITGNTIVKEGETLNLTCSVESFPPSLAIWMKPSDQNMQNGTGTNQQNDIKPQNETGMAILSISNVTADDSGQYICTVNHLNNTLKKKANVTVIYVKEVRITGNTIVKEGETLNLTCSVESFPPSLAIWMKPSDQNMQNGTGTNQQNDIKPQNETGMATLSISNVTADDSGQYICTVNHLNNTLKKKANVTVIYIRQPGITGNTTVKMGDSLNLTCSVQSFPPASIMWTKPGFKTTMHSGSDTDPQTNTGSATLFIHNMRAEHSGLYTCTVKHLNTTLPVSANVTVICFPKILSTSGCEVRSEVLTCACISEGFPLPTIKWPLLENHTEYSVITSVSNHTVNSTIILTVNHGNRFVECVSRNKNGETKQNFFIRQNLPVQHDKAKELLGIVSRLEIIIAFLIGGGLSAIVCCLAKRCHRKREKISGNLDETLEMVTSQEDRLIYDGAAGDDDHGAVSAEKVPGLDSGPTDVEYASINFALLQRRSPRKAATKESTQTEYAEIKKTLTEETEGVSGEEGQVLEDKEEDALIKEDEKTPLCEREEEDEGEDTEVYSNVNDIMGEI